MLITDGAANLDEMFAPGDEMVAFERVDDDLIDKVRYYLDRRSAAEQIGGAGPAARAARSHVERAGEAARGDLSASPVMQRQTARCDCSCCFRST
jgi:glycosyl transferase family 1